MKAIAAASADNDVAMETPPLPQKCRIPQWARGGALRQRKTDLSSCQLAWEQAGSLGARWRLTAFLANEILAGIGLNESGCAVKGGLDWKRDESLGNF